MKSKILVPTTKNKKPQNKTIKKKKGGDKKR